MSCCLGITGGIGSGKSTVSLLLQKKGIKTFDADKVNHWILRRPEVIADLSTMFSREIIGEDGQIDRRKLGAIVFADNNNRAKCEAYLHPLIEQQLVDLRNVTKHSTVAIEIPLLYECGLEYLVDAVIVVDASLEKRIERIISRNNLTREEALARINSQMSLAEKVELADEVIHNDTDSMDDLGKEIDRLFTDGLTCEYIGKTKDGE